MRTPGSAQLRRNSDLIRRLGRQHPTTLGDVFSGSLQGPATGQREGRRRGETGSDRHYYRRSKQMGHGAGQPAALVGVLAGRGWKRMRRRHRRRDGGCMGGGVSEWERPGRLRNDFGPMYEPKFFRWGECVGLSKSRRLYGANLCQPTTLLHIYRHRHGTQINPACCAASWPDRAAPAPACSC